MIQIEEMVGLEVLGSKNLKEIALWLLDLYEELQLKTFDDIFNPQIRNKLTRDFKKFCNDLRKEIENKSKNNDKSVDVPDIYFGNIVSEQPEIIRCKECKYRFHDADHGRNWCNRITGAFRVTEDDFCSYAVGRTDE